LLVHDARFAARMLRRQPVLTVPAVLSLTLGIAAGTIIFTFVKAVFLPALPVQDPSQLVLVYSTTRNRAGELTEYQSTSYLNAKDYQRRNTVFTGLAVIVDSACTLELGDRSSRVVLNLTTADYFDVLGVAPERGRALSNEDDDRNSPAVVVVSHALWMSQLGGRDDVVGTSLRLNRRDFTIVGVMPPEFVNVGELPAADVWIPDQWHDALLTGSIREWYSLRAARVASMVARLKTGVSVQQAEAAMTAIGTQLERDYPNENAGRSVMLVPLAHTVVPPSQRATYVRSGAIASAIVGVVLLIACSNVAHLLLARASLRQMEFSIRAALGASRRDIVRQLLIEGLLLAAVACASALLTAYSMKAAAVALVRGALRANLDFTFDGRVVLFTIGLSVLTAVVFALAPAWRAARRLGAANARAGDGRVIGSRSSVHHVLIAGQIGLAMVALATAALFIRSLRAAERTDLGFDLDRLVVASLDVGSLRYAPAQVRTFFDAVTDRLRALPVATSVALSDTPPLSGSYRRTVFPGDVDTGDPSNGRLTGIVAVTPRFFETVAMRLLRGRDFDDRDEADRPLVAIVNEAAARTLFGEAEPIGTRLRFLLQDWDVRVVGVVNTVVYASVNEAPQPIIYVPWRQHPAGQATLYVKTMGDPDATARAIRTAVTALEPRFGSTRLRTGRQLLDQFLTTRRLGAQLLGAFGGVALVLAVLGAYGVVAYTVGQTTREIAIRVALGSTRREMFGRALCRSLSSVAAGIGAGLLLETAVSRSIGRMLFRVGELDPLSFAGAAAVLAAAASIACAIPVWRATAVDPMTVLRSE
jgi:predicted permease